MTEVDKTITSNEEPDFILELYDLFAMNDRPKTLTIYALLQRDPGEDYTESEIQQAIKHLRNYDEDMHTPIVESAVQWLQRLPRAEQITA